jgi:ubiquinone/menaquinone biosynthesis C-methylase UbiE
MTRSHPIFARYYARASSAMEGGIAEHRGTLLAGLDGQVIEVGAGNGLNFAHYPAGVTAVLAVEPEPLLRRLAQDAAAKADVAIEVVDGDADRLPVKDGSCDAVIASLVLCSVPDPDRALAEMFRVLKPGGTLRFFEHVRADSTGRRVTQRVLDATIWPFLVGGCHVGRDSADAIRRAGFSIERLERLSRRQTRIPFPASPQILGAAIRPIGDAGQAQ